MDTSGRMKVGRNDPCPCGSGKKYKRCCLLTKPISMDSLWARQREASDKLTRDMMRFAGRKFGEMVDEAWQDFNMSDEPDAIADRSIENQIFMPYFLFHWDPDGNSWNKHTPGKGGVVVRWYTLEKAKWLTEMDRTFLEQAATQPVSFHEVLKTEPGERIVLRDLLIGSQNEVIERSASRTLRPGDIAYAQVWNLSGVAILGCCAPLPIPPSGKVDVFALRKKLRKRIAKQNRDLTADDLIRYADDVRETYVDIRDALFSPPVLCNTDGDSIVYHTLTFRVESAEEALDALTPLAMGRSKEDLLEDAEFDEGGKLRSLTFDWLKKGNRKFSSWNNTILGSMAISRNSLVAEVNSAERAARIRAEIEKRLGVKATHLSTVVRSPDELLESSLAEEIAQPIYDKDFEDDIFNDPEVKKQAAESVQKLVEGWVHQKIPVLGNRTPLQAVRDPEGKEIVESLLLEWERRVEDGFYFNNIQPDIQRVRKLLDLGPPTTG
jgi:hypothetical protein